MRIFLRFMVMIGIAAAMSGCRSFYNPAPANVPLLSMGTEFQGELHMGSAGYGAQAAWAPTYGLGLIGSGSTFTIIGDSSGINDYRQIYGELGAGTWGRFSKVGRFEVYAGFGTGSAGGQSRRLMNRFFLQPSAGISSRIIDLAFTPRLTYGRHFETRNGGSAVKVSESAAFFEPTLTARVGYEQVKFALQFGYSIPLKNEPFDGDYRNSYLSLGIHINFTKNFEAYTD